MVFSLQERDNNWWLLSDDNFNEDLANMIKNFTIINLVPRK